MIYAKIAIRNVVRRSRGSAILIVALAIGVAVLLFVNALTAGLTETVQEKFGALLSGHVYAFGTEYSEAGVAYQRVSNEAPIEQATDQLREVGIEVTDVVRKSQATASVITGPRETSVTLQGLAWEDGAELFRFLRWYSDAESQSVLSEALPDPAPGLVYLPVETGRLLRVTKGDEVLVRLYTASGQLNTGKLVVAGFYETDLEMNVGGAVGGIAYTALHTVNELLLLPEGTAQSYHLYIADPSQMAVAAEVLRDTLPMQSDLLSAARQRVSSLTSPPAAGTTSPAAGTTSPAAGTTAEAHDASGAAPTGRRGAGARLLTGSIGGAPGAVPGGMAALLGGTLGAVGSPGVTYFRIQTLEERTQGFTDLLGTLNAVSFAAFALLLAITVSGMVSHFQTVVRKRTAEIGTMRAVGVRAGEVGRIIIWEAALLVLIGFAGGLLLSLVAVGVASASSISISGALAIFLERGRLTFAFSGAQIVLNAVVLMVAGLLGALIPASSAARLEPTVAMGREE